MSTLRQEKDAASLWLARWMPLELPDALRVFLLTMIVLQALTWGFALVVKLAGAGFPWTEPYQLEFVGTDFSDFQHRFTLLHTYAFFHSPGEGEYMYPAPLTMFYAVLFRLWGPRPHVIFALWSFIALAVVIVTAGFVRALRRRGISLGAALWLSGLTIVLSWPLYYECERGNAEIALWVMLVAAVYALMRGHVAIFGVLIGLTAACKIYPIILLGVCLTRRRWKAIPIALAVVAAVTPLTEWWLGPTYGIVRAEIKAGMATFLSRYVMQNFALGWDHSFFAFFKAVAQPFHPRLSRDTKMYMTGAAVVSTVVYFVRIRKLPLVNQLAILMILSFTLPPVSFDYTLLHLYICWGVFALYLVDRWRAGVAVPKANLAMALFGAAVSPYVFVAFGGAPYGAQVRFLALAGLLYVFLRYPFPAPGEEVAVA